MGLNWGFDIDGVLYNYHEIAYRYAKNFLNIKDTYQKFWTEIDQNYSSLWIYNLLRHLPLYDKVNINFYDLTLLEYLSDIGDNIYYITSRPKSSVFVTNNWMMWNKLPQTYNLIFSKNKKVPVSLYEIDYFIDDDIKYIKDLENYTNVIVKKKIWNKDVWDIYPTINNLTEILDIIRKDR